MQRLTETTGPRSLWAGLSYSQSYAFLVIQRTPGARRTKADGTKSGSRRRAGAADALSSLFAAVVSGTPRDLALTAAATLSTLERTGPRRITDLAIVQGVTQPSMTALVTGLERSGLVERLSDPSDKRVTLVAVTPQGSEYMSQRRDTRTEALAELINKLPAEETATLMAAVPALTHLRDLYTQQRDPTPPTPKR
jgi:DNA-binding MarR family transcriptional regulator